MTVHAASFAKNRRPTVAILAPQFPPSNLAAVHRPRLVAKYLPELGYEPIVITLAPEHYETVLDPGLASLIDPGTQVIRTGALATRPLRLIGDTSLRSFVPHARVLSRLRREGRLDLIYVPMPPNYQTLLAWYWRVRHGVPFVADITDPWVCRLMPGEWRSPKALGAHTLARLLEPLALPQAAGFATVAAGYVEPLLRRHPELRRRPTAVVPFGFDPDDQRAVEARGMASEVLRRPTVAGKRGLFFAGVIHPLALPTIDALFRGLARLRAENAAAAADLHFVFVGAGAPQLGAMAQAAAVADAVTEVPERQGYLEVAAGLSGAHAALIIGTSERHYTASKLFQVAMAGRPILAVVHAESTIVGMARMLTGVEMVTFDDGAPPLTRVAEIAAALGRIAAQPARGRVRQLDALPAELSARAAVTAIAQVFDQVLDRPSPAGQVAARRGA